MSGDFVESREGVFYLSGSRVPLDLIVREFQLGESPEAIRSHYPTLDLLHVYGAITFYLGNRDEVERGLAQREQLENEFGTANSIPTHLREKLEQARQQSSARQR